MGLLFEIYYTAISTPYGLFVVGVAAGAALEYTKIHWKPFGVNFYEVFRRNQVKKAVADYKRELEIALALSKSKKD